MRKREKRRLRFGAAETFGPLCCSLEQISGSQDAEICTWSQQRNQSGRPIVVGALRVAPNSPRRAPLRLWPVSLSPTSELDFNLTSRSSSSSSILSAPSSLAFSATFCLSQRQRRRRRRQSNQAFGAWLQICFSLWTAVGSASRLSWHDGNRTPPLAASGTENCPSSGERALRSKVSKSKQAWRSNSVLLCGCESASELVSQRVSE